MIEEINKIDKALDELLVNLGGMVLRLADPEVTRTPETRQALARSVHQFSTCALTSKDARVRTLAVKLEATLIRDDERRLPVPASRLTLVATSPATDQLAEADAHGDETATGRPRLRLVTSR